MAEKKGRDLGRDRVLKRRHGSGPRLNNFNSKIRVLAATVLSGSLTTVTKKSDGSLIAEFHYAYDNVGNRRYEWIALRNLEAVEFC